MKRIYCPDTLRVAPVAMGRFRMEKTPIHGGRATLGTSGVTDATWAGFAKANSGVADKRWADPQLNLRSHMLRTDSLCRAGRQYHQPMGAVLPEFRDWFG
jgi:hypothetical protein